MDNQNLKTSSYQPETIIEVVGENCYIYKNEKDKQQRGGYLKKKWIKENPLPKLSKNSYLTCMEGRVYLLGGQGAPEVTNYYLKGDKLTW